MNWRDAATYVLPFVGALVFSASVGGAVLGGYAAVQEDLGLCGVPEIAVTAPGDIDHNAPNGTVDPAWTRLDYEELNDAEKEAFEEAAGSVGGTGKVHGELEHESAFGGGALVAHEGEEYYVAIETMDECVAVSGFVLPAGVVGSFLGLGLFYSPRLSRWLTGRRSRGD